MEPARTDELALGEVIASGSMAPGAILDELPTGVLVIDATAGVRYANREVRRMLGWSDDGTGRSMFDFVPAEYLATAATALAEGPQYFGNILGPMRMQFVDASGQVRFTEYWGRELDDRSGYVLVAPHGSVIDLVGDAVQAIAMGQPIERAVELIVAGFGVYPMTGSACLLRVVDDELHPMTPWPLAPELVEADGTPWRLAARSGRSVDVNDPADLPADVADVLGDTVTGSLWCRPVIGRRGEVSAVIVVFRPFVRAPTANQQHRMEQLVNVAALAFDQLEYRSTLERAAFTDHLTGAATRARLRQELDDGLAWSAVLYLDLDGFKEINDVHGHGAGDAVLIEVGGRLRRLLRADDLVVRVGGDEFVLVVRDASVDDAARIARRVVDAIQRPCAIDGKLGLASVAVGASVGVCARTGDMPFDEATRLADEALGTAKALGKGRFAVAPH